MTTEPEGMPAELGPTGAEATDEHRRLSELVGLLRKLRQDLGPVEAAAELGIAYTTLRRCTDSGVLTERVRLALERYDMLRHGADVSDSPFVARLKALEERLALVEERATVQGDLVGRIAADVSRLSSKLDHHVSLVARHDQMIERLSAEVKELKDRADAAPSKASGATSGGRYSSDPVGPASSGGAANEPAAVSEAERQKQAVLKEWEAVKSQEESARTKLERATARIRRIELELELTDFFKHKETIPPGELWSDTIRSREREVRWELLAEAQDDRRRRLRRRCVRRVLTLGLWRS